jgi:hypothetical protein
VVFAGPQGSVIDFADVLMFIDERGNAVERKKDFGEQARGGVGAAGEVPASWEERLTDGNVLDHLRTPNKTWPMLTTSRIGDFHGEAPCFG